MSRSSSRVAGARLAALSTVVASLMACQSGCGEGEGPKLDVPTYPASGKVLRANGSPLPGGIVVLVPPDPKSPKATGPIASDGTFNLNTDGIAPGAPAGDYKVRIELDPEADMSVFGTKRGLPFPAKYAKESTSGLTATIQAAGVNEFTFALK
ncbi:hypothetical protein EP7_003019 [Isosphaeraceae bacterium EP7]